MGWKWQGLPNERKVGSTSPVDWVAILDTYTNTLESPPSHLKEGNNNIKPYFSISCQFLSIFLAYLTRIDSENSAKHHSLQKTSDFSLMGSGIPSGFTHNWHSPTHSSCKYRLTCVLTVTSLWRPGMQRPCLSLFTTCTWHTGSCQSVCTDWMRNHIPSRENHTETNLAEDSIVEVKNILKLH